MTISHVCHLQRISRSSSVTGLPETFSILYHCSSSGDEVFPSSSHFTLLVYFKLFWHTAEKFRAMKLSQGSKEFLRKTALLDMHWDSTATIVDTLAAAAMASVSKIKDAAQPPVASCCRLPGKGVFHQDVLLESAEGDHSPFTGCISFFSCNQCAKCCSLSSRCHRHTRSDRNSYLGSFQHDHYHHTRRDIDRHQRASMYQYARNCDTHRKSIVSAASKLDAHRCDSFIVSHSTPWSRSTDFVFSQSFPASSPPQSPPASLT